MPKYNIYTFLTKELQIPEKYAKTYVYDDNSTNILTFTSRILYELVVNKNLNPNKYSKSIEKLIINASKDSAVKARTKANSYKMAEEQRNAYRMPALKPKFLKYLESQKFIDDFTTYILTYAEKAWNYTYKKKYEEYAKHAKHHNTVKEYFKIYLSGNEHNKLGANSPADLIQKRLKKNIKQHYYRIVKVFKNESTTCYVYEILKPFNKKQKKLIEQYVKDAIKSKNTVVSVKFDKTSIKNLKM